MPGTGYILLKTMVLSFIQFIVRREIIMYLFIEYIFVISGLLLFTMIKKTSKVWNSRSVYSVVRH